MPSPSNTRDEAERILRLAKNDPLRAFGMVERQMSVLVLRTQVMLSLSGIVITVTGFSGRAIAETSELARASIAAGIFIVLLAAAVAITGVLRLQWLTQFLDDDPLKTIETGLRIRDAKSRSLSLSLGLFVIGFGCYCLAIAQLLLATKPLG